MSDFDDILKKMREAVDGMADDARQKYDDLKEYLDTHDTEEIKANLGKGVFTPMFEKELPKLMSSMG